MKNIRFKYIGVLLLVMLVLGSCKKWIDTGLNTNPDAPLDVPMSSLLPAIQANMAYVLIDGNDCSRVTSQWMQYYQGIARQSQGESNYIWHDGDVDNLWNTSYSGIMYNIHLLKGKAVTTKNMMFLGIADVLMAESIGYVTDLWGDVPFSQAFQGAAQLNTPFDKQQAVYPQIIALLDEAIASLQSANLLYGYGDLIYPNVDEDPTVQGALWLKAAYGMKARYILHTSKVDGQAFANALAAVTNSFTDNADDMVFAFGSNVGQQNPLFQFMDQRGDIAMHKTFIDMLLQRQDPRLPVYATSTGDSAHPYVGADWGSGGEGASLPGPAVNSPDAPVYFLTYAECLFIKAECEYQANKTDPQIKTDVVAGLSASLNRYGVYSAAYITGYTTLFLDTVQASLYKEIMTQKYIALYNQVETFTDFRRTNNVIGLLPNPTISAIQNVIPRRYPYSLGEKSYNNNTPKESTLWSPVMWLDGGK